MFSIIFGFGVVKIGVLEWEQRSVRWPVCRHSPQRVLKLASEWKS